MTRATDHSENTTGSSLRKMSTGNQRRLTKYLAMMRSATKAHPYLLEKFGSPSSQRILDQCTCSLSHKFYHGANCP